eukprot:jgi/Tetstr1/430985/TSEL_020739.t2
MDQVRPENEASVSKSVAAPAAKEAPAPSPAPAPKVELTAAAMETPMSPGGAAPMEVEEKSSMQKAADKKKSLRHFSAIDIDAYGLEDEDDDAIPEGLEATDKEPEQIDSIFDAVSSNMLFRNLAKPLLLEVIDAMATRDVKAGEIIIKQGSKDGKEFFVLYDGTCTLTKDADQEDKRIELELKPTTGFGELSLLYRAPRSATIVSKTDCKLWVLHSKVFTQIQRKWQAKELNARMELISSVKMLEELDEHQRELLSDALERVEFKAGETIFNQGEAGDLLYLIKNGCADVSVKGVGKVATLINGVAFGERAILNDGEVRTATVKAVSNMVCYTLGRKECQQLLGNITEVRLLKVLRQVPILKSLNNQQLYEVSKLLSLVTFKKDEAVFRKGDIGDAFYIVESGKFVAIINGTPLPNAEMERGACFGELALMSATNQRGADIIALEDGSALRLPKEDFVKHLGQLDDLHNMWRMVALSKVDLFVNLPHDVVSEIAKAMKEEVLTKGENIVTVGEDGDKFYIIESGTCVVTGKSNKKLAELKTGSHFGEAALLTKAKRAATVTVVSESCQVLSLDKDHFDSLLPGDVQNNLMQEVNNFKPEEAGIADTFNLNEVEIIKAIGMGAYGVVYLVSFKSHLYAMKTISKRHMIDIQQADVILQEKQLLSRCKNRFIVNLVVSAQDDGCLYMLMDPVLGGELFNYVVEHSTHLGLPEDHARFFAACTVLGLEYLHEQRILYRDLKLENLLISANGYLKIADLGIAKQLKVGEKTYTFKGTPDYMAPEYLNKSGVTLAADWWALGVLIFEMCSGCTPFQADDPIDMFRRIIKVDYQAPPHFSPILQDLLKRLLEKKVTRRLGCGRTGALEVKQHPWFLPIDWDKLTKHQLPVPWVPNVNIDSIPDLDTSEHPVEQSMPVSPEEQKLFDDF